MEENETVTVETPSAQILTADAMLAFAQEGKDLESDVVDDVFGGSVRIKSLTAAQAAQVQQGSIRFGASRKQRTEFNFASAERLKFRYGVTEPSLTDDQVRTLQTTAGPSFQKVLKAIDEISGTDEKAAEEDEQQFRGQGE